MTTRYLNQDDLGDIGSFLTASRPDDTREVRQIRLRCLAAWNAGRITLEALGYVAVCTELIWQAEGRRAPAQVKAQHGAFMKRLNAEIDAWKQFGPPGATAS